MTRSLAVVSGSSGSALIKNKLRYIVRKMAGIAHTVIGQFASFFDDHPTACHCPSCADGW